MAPKPSLPLLPEAASERTLEAVSARPCGGRERIVRASPLVPSPSAFLFQGLEQSAAVAVAAEAGVDPEIRDLHILPPDPAHDSAPQLAVGVMEKDSHVLTYIHSRSDDVIGHELVAERLDRAVAGIVVYRPLE
jgi:hypothetical protein